MTTKKNPPPINYNQPVYAAAGAAAAGIDWNQWTNGLVNVTANLTSGGSSTGGGGGGEDPRITAARIAAQQAQAQADAAAAQRKAATSAAVKAAFQQYGLGSLFPMIEQWAQQGLTEDAIYLNLRTTPEYAARFPAMAALSAKGRAISEAAYVDYERTAAQLSQRYGYPTGLIDSNIITTLLTGEVSAAELQSRMVISAADSLTAPADLKQEIKDYFGVDPETALKAYYLDPSIALPVLERQSAMARIGVNAVRQDVAGIDVGLAGELQDQGVTEAQAKQGFGQVAAERGFTYGKGETQDNKGLTRGTFGNAAEAAQTDRIKAARVGTFTGGGGFEQDKGGNVGLGSASR